MLKTFTNSFLKDFDIDKLLSEFFEKKFNSFEKESFIFSKNEIIHEIHFVLRGKIEICDSVDDKCIIFDNCGAGDIIGLDSVFTGVSYNNSAKVIEPAITISVCRDDFMEYLRMNIEFKLWVLNYLNSVNI